MSSPLEIDRFVSDDVIIQQTSTWLRQVVIGCNFCPFAAKAVLEKRVRMRVCNSSDDETIYEMLHEELEYLDSNPDCETVLLILPNTYPEFEKFYDLYLGGEVLLGEVNYDLIFQLVSFHPQYLFVESELDDPANYTNRSPYPTIQILREDSIDEILESYPDIDQIPNRNIEYSRNKGLAYMQALLASCFGQS